MFQYVNELPLVGKPGTIYITPDLREYVFIEGIWECLGTVEVQEPKPIQHKTYPTNCKNCGAVLKNGICEYCGTDMRGAI